MKKNLGEKIVKTASDVIKKAKSPKISAPSKVNFSEDPEYDDLIGDENDANPWSKESYNEDLRLE